MFSLKDRVAVITGASSGLGVQMAQGLAGQGADVVLLARRESKLRKVAADIENQYGVKAYSVVCDVTNLDSVKAAAKATMDLCGKVDILVNNAGTGSVTPAEKMEDDVWQGNIDIDLTGVFRVAREYGKLMLEAATVALSILLRCMGWSETVNHLLPLTMQPKAGLSTLLGHWQPNGLPAVSGELYLSGIL